MFQEQSTTYYILKPIIRRCFPQNLCHFVHFGAISLIHSALEINEKGFGAFSVQSCEGFLFPCYLISHFFLSFLIFLTITAVESLFKLTILPQMRKKVFLRGAKLQYIDHKHSRQAFRTRTVVWTLMSHGSRPRN